MSKQHSFGTDIWDRTDTDTTHSAAPFKMNLAVISSPSAELEQRFGVLVMDAEGKRSKRGTNAIVYPAHGEDNQVPRAPFQSLSAAVLTYSTPRGWRQAFDFDTSGRVVPRHAPSLCLDIKGGLDKAGLCKEKTPLIFWTMKDEEAIASNQQFSLDSEGFLVPRFATDAATGNPASWVVGTADVVVAGARLCVVGRDHPGALRWALSDPAAAECVFVDKDAEASGPAPPPVEASAGAQPPPSGIDSGVGADAATDAVAGEAPGLSAHTRSTVAAPSAARRPRSPAPLRAAQPRGREEGGEAVAPPKRPSVKKKMRNVAKETTEGATSLDDSLEAARPLASASDPTVPTVPAVASGCASDAAAAPDAKPLTRPARPSVKKVPKKKRAQEASAADDDEEEEELFDDDDDDDEGGGGLNATHVAAMRRISVKYGFGAGSGEEEDLDEFYADAGAAEDYDTGLGAEDRSMPEDYDPSAFFGDQGDGDGDSDGDGDEVGDAVPPMASPQVSPQVSPLLSKTPMRRSTFAPGSTLQSSLGSSLAALELAVPHAGGKKAAPSLVGAYRRASTGSVCSPQKVRDLVPAPKDA